MRTAGLAACVCGLGLAGADAASAASLQRSVPGNSLGVDLACFRQLRIEPSAALHGGFRIAATADYGEELAGLLIGAPGGAVVRMRPGPCWRSGPAFTPTLSVAIEVPVATPISLEASGTGDTTIGAVDGPIEAGLAGTGGLTAADARGLKLHLSGTPSAAIGSVEGDATVELSGQPKVTIDRVDVDRLSIGLSGAGAVRIGEGRIGTATVEASGTGQVVVRAVTGDATAEASGATRVTFARVTGRFEHETEGMATIGIGR